MSGSKYNEGYSFNPSTFLYLQPEVQVREDITTVEEAKVYYDGVKDDPNMVVEVDTYIWSTVDIPKRFDALIYLIAHKYEMNISPLNEAIRLSMQIDRFSYCEINDGGNFQPTIKSVAKLIDDEVFQFDMTSSFMIKDESLKIGDIVQIQAVGNNLAFQTVTVVEIIDQYTVKMKSKDPEKTFSDIGRPYKVIGIYIYDLERLSRINYLRYLIENDDSQSIISVLDTEFNSRLYQTLYPVTRSLDEYSAYQDYIENRIEDDNTIGKVDDIIRVIRNLSSTDSNDTGPSSIFTDITVTEKVILDFNDTGYIKFNDQYVYYITNNHIRPSRDINNAFPGLITEWAIKKYFEDKIAETVEYVFLEFLKTEDFFEFGGDVIVHGDFSALGDSNLLLNAQLCNADIVSADINGIDGEDAMIFLNRDSNVIAYIHDDGLFVSSYIGVNVDIPQHNLDVCGDLGVSGPVFLGSDLTVEGTISGNVIKIDGDESMIFMNEESNVIAYIHDDGLFVSSYLGVNVDIPQHNVDICGDLGVSGPMFIGSNLSVEGDISGNVLQIDGDESMIFMTGESNVIAYIYDDGIFVSSYLGVNVDIPQHNVDICGDLGVSGPVFFESDLTVCGLMAGNINEIEGDNMIFMTRNLDIVALLHEDFIILGKPIGINTDAPEHDVDIVGDLSVSGPVYMGSNLSVCGEIEGGVNGIDSDNMIFLTQDFDVIAFLREDSIVLAKPLGINTEDPRYSVDIVGDLGVSGPVYFGSDVHIDGGISVDGTIRAGQFLTQHELSSPDAKEPLSNVLDKLANVQGYRLYRDGDGDGGESNNKDSQIGLFDEELKQEFPEIITDGTNGSYGVDYGSMTAILVSGIRDLKVELDKQKEINDALIADLENLRDKVDKIST